MADKLIIFDTTLRDGEQSPGCSMNLDEKLAMARQLARLQVDVIEAPPELQRLAARMAQDAFTRIFRLTVERDDAADLARIKNNHLILARPRKPSGVDER